MKFSQLFIIPLLFLLTSELLALQYWTKISSPVSNTLTNCAFINNSTGWIGGESGSIIRTTNGGANWQIQNSGTSYNIEDIFFLNERLGYALAWNIFPDTNSYLGTIILNTTNGGLNWTQSMYPDTNWFMKTVFYLDSLNGFMGGVPSVILKTTNAGQRWVVTDTDSSLWVSLPVYKIKFINSQTGYACGGFRDIAGLVWATTNSGLNWKGAAIAPEPFFDLSIIYPYKAIASGGDLEYGSSIARTVNTGLNWYYDTLGVFGLSTGISFRTPAEGWMAAGFSQKFIVSYDSGFTWNSVYATDSSEMFDVDFPDSTYGFACGRNGVILKYDRTISDISGNLISSVSKKFMLYQNYPNPFNPKTIINYHCPISNFVSLKVYDMLGIEIATLVYEKQNAGNYSVEFDGRNFPSGIYYCKLIAGDFSEVRKMILVK